MIPLAPTPPAAEVTPPPVAAPPPDDDGAGEDPIGVARDAETRPLTDLGNGERFALRHGGNGRYCYRLNRWFVWSGRHWEMDEGNLVADLAKRTVRSIYAEAAAEPVKRKRLALAAHAKASERDARIAAMLNLAKSEPGIPVKAGELDAHPWLLACRNGTLDLATGEFREHRRADLITKVVPTAYAPAATCPHWEAFLAGIIVDTARSADRETIAFLGRALGSSLTGITRDRVLLILWGLGRNGKTTLLEVIREVLGPAYAMRTPVDTLLTKRDSAIPNDVARLRGARFVTASEADEGRRLAEATIKDLTGGDTISARFMRAEWFEFLPEFKLFLATNHKPVIRGVDHAVWDRIRLVPFLARFVTREEEPNAPAARLADPGLRERLIKEAPGILAWLVAGCRDWRENGLGYPTAVREATQAYRDESDLLAVFIADRCILDPNAHVSSKELYAAYGQWAEENNVGKQDRLTQTAMGKRLAERGLEPDRLSDGRRIWRGIGLVGGEEPPSPEPSPTRSTGFDTFDGLGGIGSSCAAHEALIPENVSNVSKRAERVEGPAEDPPEGGTHSEGGHVGDTDFDISSSFPAHEALIPESASARVRSPHVSADGNDLAAALAAQRAVLRVLTEAARTPQHALSLPVIAQRAGLDEAATARHLAQLADAGKAKRLGAIYSAPKEAAR